MCHKIDLLTYNSVKKTPGILVNRLKRSVLFVLITIGLCLSTPILAAKSIIPRVPDIKATGHILMDFDSGYVITSNKADERMEPASLTKMMSSYVIATEISKGTVTLEDKVKISEEAWRMPGSRMFVDVNSWVSVQDLLMGVIVQSGNDATLALAQHVAGSEDAFASMMNQHAERLGLENTHFVNSTGLPHTEHYSSARDLAMLGHALIRDFPDHYEWYAVREYKYNKISQKNRNTLLWRDQSVDGIKTGHTESAGYCLVASAKRGEMRLISVVLGTSSKKARADESQKLLTYGFRFFETHKLYSADEALTNVRIWKGDSETVGLGLNQDLYITIPRGQYKNLDAQMSLNTGIIAPVTRGQTLGSVNVKLGDESFAVRDLVAMKDVAEGGFFSSLLDTIKLKLQ